MPKVGGRRKKLRSHKEPDTEQQRLTPKTFIIKKGKCPEELRDLVLDLRKCFYPNTAMKLQDTNKMSIKSYLKAAKFYNVNHLITLQSLNDRDYIRFIKLGGGQMTFRIMNFSRMKEIINHGGQPFSYSFKQSLLVLNGFNDSQQVKMIAKGLQQLFPSLNLARAKTEHLKRVISFSYRPKKKFIFFRQYKIVQSQGGVSSNFQKLMDKPKDLSNFRSLKQYLESQESNIQGNQNQQKLNLVQIGPRLKLKFISYKQSAGVLSEKELEDLENQFQQNEDRQAKQQRHIKKRNLKNRKKQQQQKNQPEQEQQNQMQEEDNNEQIHQSENIQNVQQQDIDLESADQN